MRCSKSRSVLLAAGSLAVFGGCGSVTMPEEHYYRLELPDLGLAAVRSADVLRVEGFELASSLTSDRLLVAESPVQLRAYEFHRWISPLQRLVQDAVTIGLTRARAFTEVRGPADGSGETLVLTGRILEFQQSNIDGEWAGLVTLELRLEDAREGRGAVLHGEFTNAVRMVDESPSAAVQALSHGMTAVLKAFLARCAERGVLADPARPGK